MNVRRLVIVGALAPSLVAVGFFGGRLGTAETAHTHTNPFDSCRLFGEALEAHGWDSGWAGVNGEMSISDDEELQYFPTTYHLSSGDELRFNCIGDRPWPRQGQIGPGERFIVPASPSP